ncbi:MAG: hypothetical protein FJ006_04490 [Chloroflexi bacterium]|nr:hypothetical protein [Chloroflexota bacterium]
MNDILADTFFLGLVCHLFLNKFPTRDNVDRVDTQALVNAWIPESLVADAIMKAYNKDLNMLPLRIFEFHYRTKIEPVLNKQLKMGFWSRAKCRSYFRNLFFSGARFCMLFDLATGRQVTEMPHADKIKEMIFGKEERTESLVEALFEHADETDEMLAQISRDPSIGRVLGQYGRTSEHLKDIWWLLLMTGTGEKKALSIVRNPKLLSRYLQLEAEGNSPIEIVAKLLGWE